MKSRRRNVVNPKYLKGRRFEWKVKELLEAYGWFVLRAAGSKPVDLLALKPAYRPIMVECKTGKYVSKADVKRLETLALKAGARLIIAKPETFNEEFKERGLI